MAHSDNEDKKEKIKRIEIEKVENGYAYTVFTEKEDSEKNNFSCGDIHKYVYEEPETVVAKVKDDLMSPHLRKENKKSGTSKFTDLAIKARRSERD